MIRGAGGEAAEGDVGMGRAMSRAETETAGGSPPALLKAQMQAQLPEQVSTGTLTGQSIKGRTSRHGDGVAPLRIGEQSLRALVPALQPNLPLRPGPARIRGADSQPLRDENNHGHLLRNHAITTA